MNLMPSNLAELAWAQLWQVTLLAVAVAVVVHLAARARPHLAYLLWMLVIIKCLTPPLWSSSAGLFSWAQLHVAPPVSHDLVDPLAGYLPGWLIDDPMFAGQPVSGPAVQTPADVTSAPATTITLPALLAAIWLTGASVLAALVLAKWLRRQALLQSSATDLDPAIGRLIKNLSRRFGLRRKVHVVVLAKPVVPAVFGWWQPTIVLPEALLAAKSRKHIEPILAHELIHVRRGDTLAAPVQLVAQILWWFHPLVWWANRQARRARERCADQEVVTGLACPPTRYARGLLDVVELLGPLRHEPLSSGVHLSNITVTRLEEIMNHADRFCRRTPVAYWIVLLLAGMLVLPGAGLTLSASPQASAETEAGASDEAADLTNDNSRAADAEREAVAALKESGARITRNPDGKVVGVNLGGNKRITDRALEHIKGLSHLESLQLHSTQITDADLVHLTGLTKLKRLNLGGPQTQITDAGVVHLKGLTNLEHLVLFRTRITDAGLVHLKGLTKLQSLILGGPDTHITDDGLVHLKGLTNVTSLRLPYTQVTGTGLTHLQELTKLQALHLPRSQLTDVGLAQVNALANLQQLTLRKTKVSDAGLRHLKELTELQLLEVSDTQVTGAGLVHLKNLPSLTKLILSGPQITDVALEHIKGLPHLKALHLDGEEVSNVKLELLDGLSNIHEFGLFRTQVTDEGVVYLQRLPNMKSLILFDSHEITDGALEHLQRLTSLERLDVRGTKISHEGFNHLKEALPDCEIMWDVDVVGKVDWAAKDARATRGSGDDTSR